MQKLGFSIIILVLLGTVVYGANPTYKYFAMNGGINREEQIKYAIKDNQLYDAQNVYSDGSALATRLGYEELNGTAISDTKDDLIGLYDFQLPGGTRKLVTVDTDGKVYKMDSLDGTWDDITPVAGDLTDDRKIDFEVFTDTAGDTYVFIANGTDEIQKWDGASANADELTEVSGGDVPEVQYLKVFNSRLWGAGDPGNLNILYCTATSEADDWGNGEALSVDVNDGDEITGLAIMSYSGDDFYDKLIVFKKNKTYAYTVSDATPSNWTRSMISDKVGCLSHWSIQTINNNIIFLSSDGWYVLSQGKLEKISTPINPIFDDLNPVRLDDACSVLLREEEQYLCSVSDGSATEHDTIIVLDYKNMSWWVYSGISAASLAEVIDSTTNDYNVYFGDYDGKAHKFWTGTNDNGTAIDSYFITKSYTFGSIEWQKRVMYLYTYAVGSGEWDLTAEYALDSATTFNSETIDLTPAGSLWGTMEWGDDWGAEADVRIRYDLGRTCYAITLKYQIDTLDQYFKIYGWSFNVQPLQRDN